MRKTASLLILILGIVVIACVPQKKIYYEFPPEMLDNVKVQYAELCEKGRALYQINCAGCHTTKKGRKEIIPDFTSVQLEAYQIRIANATHEEKVSEEKVTAEELSYILTYLNYKTKSNVTLKGSGAKPH
jgi:hypothetical protein